MQIQTIDFNQLYCDKEVKKWVSRAVRPYSKILTQEELEDCKTDALLAVCKLYDPNKGNTIKNSVYRQIIWKCKYKIRAKNKKQIKTVHIDCDMFANKLIENSDLRDSIQSLPNEIKKIILQKFYYRYTLDEIGKLNNQDVYVVKLLLDEGIRRLKEIWCI